MQNENIERKIICNILLKKNVYNILISILNFKFIELIVAKKYLNFNLVWKKIK